jgi:DNA polymerase III delta prime subunit
LARILYILEKEKIKYDEEGLEALVFTSDGFYLILGDMR